MSYIFPCDDTRNFFIVIARRQKCFKIWGNCFAAKPHHEAYRDSHTTIVTLALQQWSVHIFFKNR